MRLEIVRRALGSHQPIEEDSMDELDDPEGINVPWEEKYGQEDSSDEELEDWQKDPEGISIPWEEKYGKGDVCE